MENIVQLIIGSFKDYKDDFDEFYRNVLGHIYKKNQFVNVHMDFKAIIKKVWSNYEEYDEFNVLESKLIHLLENYTDLIIQNGDVVCEEYKPETQLIILGIRLPKVKGPVLDLGCGESGNLVRHLRKNKIIAVGIDRLVKEEQHLISADWLRTSYGVGKWGTIISHMAFTNHFNYHHKYVKGEPQKYAETYMALLKALKVGGTFYYSPSVEFMEVLLDPFEYEIKKELVKGEIYRVAITRMF